MINISTNLQVNGAPVPISSYSVEGGSVGSAGHLTAVTSLIALDEAGLDLVETSIQDPTDVTIDLFVTVNGTQTHLFSGEYVTATWNYKQSSVTIHSRDWSGPIIDQKRVLVSTVGGFADILSPAQNPLSTGVVTMNQTITELVTSIAKQFSLTPVLNLDGNNPTVGQIFGTAQDAVYSPQPQSLWAILTRLARDSGNIVYVNPQKQLVFGIPGAGLTPIALSWLYPPPIPPTLMPLIDLSIEHNPRRNLTFQVIVLSYDPTHGQITKGQAYVIGSNINASSTSTVQAGMWTGTSAQNVAGTLSSGSKTSKKNKIPIYTFHVDGLPSAQAQSRANAIAADIAKRELIVSAEADFVPLTAPSNPATLTGSIDAEFAAHNYFVTGYTHTMRMAQGRGAEFATHMRMFDVQPAGTGNAVSGAAA